VPSAQPSAQAIKSLEPLLTSSPVNTSALAASLHDALSFSGLFYESHLLQWFLGDRLLADIQKESRLRLAAMKRNGKEPLSDESPTNGHALIADKKSLLARVLESAEPTENNKNFTALSDPLNSALLREQVETLLSGIFHWQGTVWKDQSMEWEVEKKDREGDHESEHTWRTTLQISLPNLGKISATIISSDEGITGKISTDSTTTKNTMQRELEGLKERMAGAGLSLITMAIEQSDEG
jgi:hypothetical protein